MEGSELFFSLFICVCFINCQEFYAKKEKKKLVKLVGRVPHRQREDLLQVGVSLDHFLWTL